MGAPSGVRIFISHSHADNAFCLPLVQALRERYGEDAVWFDVSGGLAGGDEWWAKIRQELRSRPVFIVVLSHAAMASRWVNDEVSLAWNQRNQPGGKYLIPVVLEPDATRDDLGTLRNAVSFAPPRRFDDGFAALTKQLDAIERKLTAPAAPLAPAAERRDPRSLLLAVLAVALVVSLLAVVLASGRGSSQSQPAAAATKPPAATITPQVAATQTALTTLAYTEAVPICAPNADFWLPERTSEASSVAAFKASTATGAYVCGQGGVQLVALARSAGIGASAGGEFLGPSGASALPTKHRYQFTATGLAHAMFTVRLDSISFNLQQVPGLGWHYEIDPQGTNATMPPQLYGNVNIDNGNFSFAAAFDDQQVTFVLNGTTIGPVRVQRPLTVDDARAQIFVNTVDDQLATMTLSDFRFTAL